MIATHFSFFNLRVRFFFFVTQYLFDQIPLIYLATKSNYTALTNGPVAFESIIAAMMLHLHDLLRNKYVCLLSGQQ
jgi:hypothetical protein